MNINGITATVVFESSAVNRDEKLGGNIPSVKKLNRFNGTFTFMSRAFIRHHLFATLHNLYNWSISPVTKDKEVLQFDFPNANILDYQEMDYFGFMRTNPYAVTRKAPLGITKAISLENWQADMSFYANHDLVKRAKEIKNSEGVLDFEANPNPFSKEEHHSYYKVSFTFDLNRLGYQELVFKKIPEDIEKLFINLAEEKKEQVKKNIKNYYYSEDFEWRKCERQKQLVGYIGIRKQKDNTCIRFVVAKEEFRKRLEQVLMVIKNGIAVHSSTEDYGIVPVCSIFSTLLVPVPVFNSAVEISPQGINAELINKAAKNNYIKSIWFDSLLPVNGTLEPSLCPWDGVDKILDSIE